MKCPYCNKRLEFEAPVKENCEIYGGSPKGVTTCCGNIVQLRRIINFEAYTTGNTQVDDWGIKKTAKS